METKPEISVIVPIYDVEKYLRICVDSLLGQTLRDIEIVLIDDGSPDKCGEIADGYALGDNRIRVIHQQNQGVAVARNAGLAVARGRYIGFCDPDDWVDPDFYQKLVERADKTGASIVWGNALEFREGSKRARHYNNPRKKDMDAFCHTVFWQSVYDAGFIKENGLDFPAGVITGQDDVFKFKAILSAEKGRVVKLDTTGAPYYRYLRREGSLSSKRLSEAKIQSRIKAADIVVDSINAADLDAAVYGEFFAGWLNALLEQRFFQATTFAARLAVVKAAIEIHGKCKRPEAYAKNSAVYAKYLEAKDEIGLFSYLSVQPGAVEGSRCYKLFGLLPLWEVRDGARKRSWLLFGILPLLAAKFKRGKTGCRLFGFLPVMVKS